ncbi:MAG: molybdenum cofactor biosynthesis protein MoaE [Flavobacteriales bacterium]
MNLSSKLQHLAIESNYVASLVRSNSNGAYVTFNGEVRNHSNKQPVLFLEFEAYESMALKEMDKLLQQAARKWDINAAAIVHRLGKVEIGESAVVISVGSSHRKEAFEACQFLINELKQSVPIWKKEHLEDGVVWVSAHP